MSELDHTPEAGRVLALHMVPPLQGPQAHRRVLPQNVDAEEAVVGGVLFAGRRAWQEVVPIVRAEDFYNPVLATIFEACGACFDDQVPIDLLTVSSKLRALKTMKKLRFVGEEAFLVELNNKVSSFENITAHAQLVASAAMCRAVIFAAGEISEQATGGLGALELLEAAQTRFFQLGSRYQGLREPRPLKELLHDAVGRLEARYASKNVVTGVPTGFRDLDELTGGWQNGTLIVIGGRPAHGKSALAMQLGLHAAVEARIPTLVFHLEMTDEEVVDRAICTDARLPGQAMRTGYLTTQQFIAVAKTASRLSTGPMWIDDSVPLSLSTLTSKARRWRSNQRLFPVGERPRGLVILDYLQLLKAERSRSRNREQDVSELSHGLKALAKELQLPVIAVASLSRKCEERTDKRPVPSDLRDSGDIESDANVILFVYRDELYDPASPDRGLAELLVRKHRGGATGTVRLEFHGPTTRFTDLPPDQG